MLDKEPIHVVCAADDRYSMPLAVTLRSVLENLDSERSINFFIIDGGIKQHNKKRILKSLGSKLYTIEWLQPSTELLSKMVVSGHVKIASYFRLLMSHILPFQLQKVIYLDSDLIVLKNLDLLWDVDIGEAYLLACQDLGIPYVSDPYGLANYKELGIPADSKYFNAGVLVINLEKWRSENIGMKVIQYLEQNKDYIRWHDQDGLNAVLAGTWGELDPRWNQVPSIYLKYSSWKDSPFLEDVYKKLSHDPFIIHFASSNKPWNSRVYHPANYLFFQYLDLTVWSGWRYTIWRRAWNKIVKQAKQFNLYKTS
ncbi:MAG: glycosyltransferase family 8 protein [Stigonema ocellatum SAG 48.90 = DSM 106950]|nr:glycosyltransferase family 8 protein [Stigonema ocellatum SAG 48.90 = DSM 106950]